jgi:hypothetical protein
MDHLSLARFASVDLRGSYGHAVLLATLAVVLELDAEGQVAVDDRDDLLRAPAAKCCVFEAAVRRALTCPKPT